MKTIKLISLLLCVALLSGCGGSAEPAATPAVNSSTAQIEAKSAEPAAPPQLVETAQPVSLKVSGNKDCLDMLRKLQYIEVNPELYGRYTELSVGATGASVTPVSMEVYDDNSFRMELDVISYSYSAEKAIPSSPWVLYGSNADSLHLIPDLESQGYELYDTLQLSGEETAEPCEFVDYLYVNFGEDGYAESIAYVTVAFYPQTDKLYNVVQEIFSSDAEYGTATIFSTRIEDNLDFADIGIERLQWGEFSFELHPFILQYGATQKLYQYRPGMSLSDWACSELNTDGWIPWYDGMVLSPDRKYIAGTAYLAMKNLYGDEIMTIYADEYDGNLDHTYAYSLELSNSVENAEEALKYLKSEKAEIEANGNINVAVAHMVNARTPLFTPGFRTVGREEGRAAYHSVEMSYTGGMFLLDDIIDVYMNEIDDALIPHIKLYAFAESEEFMKSLEGQLILNAHTAPFEKDSEMLKIPENAVCLSFERVPDGQEAPNSPNPRKPGHENLNHNAVYARYITKNDPNFSGDANLVFAITFDDELVYWIHMGSHFSEKIEGVTWYVNAMGY